MLPHFGPVELTLIIVIVVMLFGVGKLPEVFGSVGRGIREFRRNAGDTAQDKTGIAATPPIKADSAESGQAS